MDEAATYRILTIEDDPAVAAGLVESLSNEGFEVHWEATGGQGLRWALDHLPHLILLDVRLPDGSGFDYLRKMRDLGLRQPILVLTVQSDEIDKVLGLELGADDYLTKPFLVRELLARVRSLLRRSYGQLSTRETQQIFAADLVIDLSRAEIKREGHELRLTPTEYRLLVFLAQNPAQAFSRRQLIEAVWGIDGELYDESTVSVQVRRLREKIEIDPSDPRIIRTVPGIGYKLVS